MLLTIVRPFLLAFKKKTNDLKENAFAHRLTNHLISNRRVPDYSELLALLYRSDKPDILDFPIQNRRADRRIKSLYLNNIRQYSLSHNNEEKNADFYCMDLSMGNDATSSIILGPNGTGKTSLYSSLEYLYTGQSEIAASHDINEDQTNNFFRSIGTPINSPHIDACFAKDEKVTDNHLQGYELPAAFCSECDYYEISRNWNAIDHYIAHQLGYNEMLETIERLDLLNRLLQSAYSYKLIQDSIAEKEDFIKHSPDPHSFEAMQANLEIINLKNKAEITEKNFNKIREDKYGKPVGEFLEDDNHHLLEEEKFREVENTLKYIKGIWHKRLQNFLRYAEPIFNKMMSEHLFKESESLKMSVENGIFSLNLDVKGNDNKETKTPISYLNTFRLKLFCVAFKMSLFCFAKNLYEINIPFVIDDIFDSSDFYHRSNIGSFIWHMVESHNDTLTSKDRIKHPLQLIFFTQDNIIAENVYRGMSNFIYEKNLEDSMKIKFGRLFRPCDAKQDDGKDTSKENNTHITETTLRGKDVKVINIVDFYS